MTTKPYGALLTINDDLIRACGGVDCESMVTPGDLRNCFWHVSQSQHHMRAWFMVLCFYFI